ncbi:MAG: histidine phosphatase family protein [Caldilineaceae bacterium]|nr:histidine phosphatase family protein [Caldilineaceae bacterium]
MADTIGTSAELWLIRHGESVGNRDNIYQGQNDLPLSALGHSQAELLAKRLARLHAGSPFSAIYSSDLQRALQTAAPVVQAIGLPIADRVDLREIDVGDWSGLTFVDIQRRFPDEWTASYPVMDPEQVRGGGESYRQAQIRIVHALARIARDHPGQRVLVFFHGGVMQAALAHIMQLPLPNKRFLHTANTSISRVKMTPENETVEGMVLCINDVAHLEHRTEKLASVGPE